MSRIRHGIRNAARHAGFDIIRLNQQETLDSHLKALTERLGINCVLDVGAHYGEYAKVLREAGYRGHIVSFEPNPESFKILNQRMGSDPMWKANQTALGDSDGTVEMSFLGVSFCDSILPLNEYGAERLGEAGVVKRTEQVKVARLETLLEDVTRHVPEPRRIFLKLDTQGYDLRVIEGAGAKLAQIQALQTEVVVKSIYQGMVDYLEALKILQNNGFELTGMFPVTRDDRDQLRVVEMDAVMCRTEAAERIIKAG
jgi:FkbM family methyltransferase